MPFDRITGRARSGARKVRNAYLTEGVPGVARKARNRLRRGSVQHARALPADPVTAPCTWPVNVLMVAERSLPQCYHYRVQQKRTILAGLGVGFTDVAVDDPSLMSRLQMAHLLIVYRLPDHPVVSAAVAEAGRLGVPVVYEVDDLVYRQDLIAANPNLLTLPRTLRSAVIRGAVGYETALRMADANLAATTALADDMSNLNGRRSFVVDNGIDDEMLVMAAAEGPSDPLLAEHCVVTYGSGSRAHDHDFAQCAPGLARWLREDSTRRLKLIGPVALPDTLTGLTDQIIRRPEALEYQQYLNELRNSTITVAPLADEPFNRFKSQVKYLEAALMGVPLIASPTVYANYVEDGRTALIAVSDDDWYRALTALSANPQLRELMARDARGHVRKWEMAAGPTEQMRGVLESLCSWQAAV